MAMASQLGSIALLTADDVGNSWGWNHCCHSSLCQLLEDIILSYHYREGHCLGPGAVTEVLPGRTPSWFAGLLGASSLCGALDCTATIWVGSSSHQLRRSGTAIVEVFSFLLFNIKLLCVALAVGELISNLEIQLPLPP